MQHLIFYLWSVLQSLSLWQRRTVLLISTGCILLAAQPIFLIKLFAKKQEERVVMEATFTPKAESPFLHVKELYVEKCRKQLPDSTSEIEYERLRNRCGSDLQALAEQKQREGMGQLASLYSAAKDLDINLPTEFFEYKWKALQPVVRTTGNGNKFPKKVVEKAVNDWGAPNDDATTYRYIESYAPIAMLEQKKFGIPASILLAQGIVESGSGTSYLAKNARNHFGIKCFSRRCKKGHCINASDDSHKDFFRKYSSAWQSWREHSQLLAGARYAKLKKYGRDYQQWAYGLKALGYATDRTYAEKLIGTIEKYHLSKFDR